MPNTIALRKSYSTMLDEVYKLASLTAVLDGPNDLVKEGANANEILIPKMTMQGLADYNKQTGYVAGDVTLEYETKKCTYDRRRMFNVDALDNIESAGVAFGRLSSEFLRTQVAPELDAWRLAAYTQLAGKTVSANIADAKAGIAALRVGKTAIKNAEANPATCYLFISATLKGDIEDLETTASKKVLEGWLNDAPFFEGHSTKRNFTRIGIDDILDFARVGISSIPKISSMSRLFQSLCKVEKLI